MNLHMLVGHTLENGQTWWTVWFGWQLLLTPWLLSTWFGDWLASQSPSPSWQHRVSLKHLHNTVILCQLLLLLGMICHMGGWDMVAYTWSTSHITCPRSDNTHGIIDNSGVGTVGQTSSKNSDFCKPTFICWGLPHTGWCMSTCFFVNNSPRKAWEIWTTKLPN